MAVFDNLNKTYSPGVAPSVVEYYERSLLENMKPEMVHTRDAQERTLPEHNGKTVKPSLAGVDQGEVAVCLRLKGELAHLQTGQNLCLRYVQLVVGQVRHLGVVHVEGQPVIDHAEGERVAALADDQPVLTEGHVGLDEPHLLLGGLLRILHLAGQCTVLAHCPGEVGLHRPLC